MQFLEIPCPKSKYDSVFLYWRGDAGIEYLRKFFPEPVITEGLRLVFSHLRGYKGEVEQDSIGSNYRRMMVAVILLEKIDLLLRKECDVEIIKFLARISSYQEGVVFSKEDKKKVELMDEIDEKVYVEKN